MLQNIDFDLYLLIASFDHVPIKHWNYTVNVLHLAVYSISVFGGIRLPLNQVHR